ncbi:MAG: anthranilate synthase component I family protein [Flavitalea sp.]
MLNWANRFNICCFLDNHQYDLPEKTYEVICAAGSLHSISLTAGNAFSQLKEFHHKHQDWIFGHLSFDLKNELEDLHSRLPDFIGFPDLHFFVPEVLCFIGDNTIRIGIIGDHHEDVLNQILSQELTLMPERNRKVSDENENSNTSVQSRFSKENYIDVVNKLKDHILRGDCYEINFCQEFYIPEIQIDPLKIFFELDKTSPNPFAAFYKLNEQYCLCASPERYLRKQGSELISQPIKGTIIRDKVNQENDETNKNLLHNSEKERAENVMVVDLVRNDLSKVCKEGSVSVKELFGIYSFPQVHQMISTIRGELRDDLSWMDAIRQCFPMGSMTGAPKKRVLELIEKYELTRRGIFSGAIGYVDANENFDFNVVIRSILYNKSSGYLSFQAGSAITFASEAAAEYEECILKASAIKKVLTN